jgi:hypothetical protein
MNHIEVMKLALKALLLEDMACRYDKEQTPQHIADAITALKQAIALDKMAAHARELGLDYEPAPVQGKCFLCGERVASCTSDVCPKSAQPAVQEGRDWSLLEATQESLREHMAEIKRLKAAQPVPVKTYSGGKPWPVAPKPWVGLNEEERRHLRKCNQQHDAFARAIEAKLKEKNA